MNIKLFFAGLLLLFCSMLADAQNYRTGIGLRGGFANGITLKHFIFEDKAIEGILQTQWRGFNIVALYEIHKPFEIKNMQWFYGVGGHLGFWNGYADHPWFKEEQSYTVLGIDGILGLEYTFDQIPLNLGLDWKPAINFVGVSNFWGDGLGLSVRYVFR